MTIDDLMKQAEIILSEKQFNAIQRSIHMFYRQLAPLEQELRYREEYYGGEKDPKVKLHEKQIDRLLWEDRSHIELIKKTIEALESIIYICPEEKE